MRSLLLVIWLALSVVDLTPRSASAAERVYYIAADEVIWDYAPSYPNNPITGEPFTKEESVYLSVRPCRPRRTYPVSHACLIQVKVRFVTRSIFATP